jgi:hypothetical protein
MTDKQHILDELAEIFNRWQSLIASLSVEQITAPDLPDGWSIKDVVAHMWAWQQASVARAEAALNDMEPNYPEWWQINGPDPNEDIDRTNAHIYKINRDKPWVRVYADWKEQFSRYLELSKQIPEKDLFEAGRYAWMGSYALSASSMGSLDHHREHFDPVSTWLLEHGTKKPGG